MKQQYKRLLFLDVFDKEIIYFNYNSREISVRRQTNKKLIQKLHNFIKVLVTAKTG